jgi:competence ComEA-like helix-hairpin-helix protein
MQIANPATGRARSAAPLALLRPAAPRRARALGALAALLALLAWAAPGAARAETPPTSGVVNINTASLEELQLLPGVGEARARAIVNERKARGGFKSVEELLEVRGIGEANLEKLRPHVVLTGKTTAKP